ncbi:hypothetical protein FW796_23280 [Pseudomonas sp. 910_21]
MNLSPQRHRVICAIHDDAFAGKPAPTEPDQPHPRRSRLAGEEALEPCTTLTAVFAGKPAPTVAFAWESFA